MQLFAFGINHQTAPLDVREQVSFPEDAMEHALHDLVAHHPVSEAAIVSTCNRTEVFIAVPKSRRKPRTGWRIFIICRRGNWSRISTSCLAKRP